MTADELAVGVGCRPGTPTADIVAAVREVVGPNIVRCLATIDRRTAEPGPAAAAATLGVPLIYFTAAQLARMRVPNPAARAAASIGTPSVAEAAALRAGAGGALTVTKRIVAGVTVAAARCGRDRSGDGDDAMPY